MYRNPGGFVPFIILFQARVGSTLLQTMLDSHPHIVATGEPFSVECAGDADRQIAWADKYWLAEACEGHACASGFKTKWSDIADADRFTLQLKRKSVRVIRMWRNNRVKTAISLITGGEWYGIRGEWNRKSGEPRLSPVEIKPEDLEMHLQFAEQHLLQIDLFVKRLGLPYLSVSYEDLVLHRDDVIKKVCRFLHVPYYPVTTSLEKITNDDLRKAICNYDELKNLYRGTCYEAMFEEVLFPEI